MMKETEDVVHMTLDFLPLKSYANIVEGNALRTDSNLLRNKNVSFLMILCRTKPNNYTVYMSL